jgi:hypothetical protein
MTTTSEAPPASAGSLYSRLEERVLDRDQVGASAVFYDVVRAGRPLHEMLRETVRIHAPYTHVPYHQRIDGGVVRFVNNDHCLLSARTALRLRRFVGKDFQFLPLAQTVWYVPTGLDPWNQLLGKMPGHYSRRGRSMREDRDPEPPPRPTVHWDDQQPLYLDGTLDERLDQWLTLVQRGEVVQAYRVFLGLLEEGEGSRDRVLAQLVFAGLIDVQDRMVFNRSYTTGHKSYRARATVELAEAVGWENAHAVIYAGVPDIAVGPRWYSNYEMAGEVAWIQLAEEPERQRSSIGPTPELPPERRLLANEAPLTQSESDMLLYALTKAPEPAYIEAISALLLAGKSPRQIVDVCQVAAARLVLETGDPRNFSMSQHCYEYTNTLGWFFDRFDHPHRLKLLYVAGSFLAQTAHWLRSTPGNAEANTTPSREADGLSATQVLQRLDDAMVRRSPAESVSWVRAYQEAGYPSAGLVRTLGLGAAKQGNDTHNQELGLCFLEDYEKSSSRHRDVLLQGCAQHTAGHIKYGDSLEPYRRFAEAFGADSTQSTQGDADPAEALLDD